MASFLSSTSDTASAPSSNRTPADLARWQNRIQEVQSTRVTPEIRQRIQDSASRKQRTMKVAKKAKRLETANYLSSTTNMFSLQRMSAPALAAPQAEQDYLESSARTMKWSSAIQNSVRSPVENDEQEEALDRELEAVSAELQNEVLLQQQITPHLPTPQALQTVQAYGAMNHQDRVMHQTTASSELDSLLTQLIREPTEEQELIAKFTLYETFLGTVITLREETMRFWADNQDLFDPYSRQLAQNEISHIDTPDTMGIQDDPHKWFVYHMTKRVNENNKIIGRILANLRTRLEMLGNEEDLGECPFCLEDMTPMAKNPEGNQTMVLTCCHRVCRECWENWVLIKGPTAFCPLCRHEEFVQDILH
jgi:hypothetical protein